MLKEISKALVDHIHAYYAYPPSSVKCSWVFLANLLEIFYVSFSNNDKYATFFVALQQIPWCCSYLAKA